jgi:hypothetical protein
LSGLGRVLRKSGKNAEAVAAFREAIAQRLQLPSLSPGATYDMASNHATLALLCNEADSGLKPEDAESETVLAMEILSKAVDIGFRDLKMLLEDSNFDSFRDRAEFKTIAERIEKVIEKP